ncbi:hypothetical protein FisN_28Hh067 [Fistulifera solaris]|uniref:Uncharacterized protein n=1 Tax=Fistulifera solaris TaxID=1519565 RepID=A0A1Z5KH89_FISSO|nr:hypothetical protein FisN_28Hh067 [Fistulifera solaris]|eukprot:GAX25596.1 hypothetical protein FisN_28Hh067 [Fistulifera solaris]
MTNAATEDATASVILPMARKLRIAMEEPLYMQQHQQQPDVFVNPSHQQQDAMLQLILLASEYAPEVLTHAVLLTNDDSLRLPIHLACDTNAPLEIIRWLLESDPKKESILRPDKWGDLPLHTACSRKDYHAVVELLLENDPTRQTVFFPDKSMALPLHTACRYQASPAVMELLLQYQPLKQLLSPGPYEQLPLHIACRCQHADAVPILLKYDKEQALIPDHTGRLPIHLAYLKQMDADTTIRCLLEAMLLGRSEQKGLVLWKKDLQSMIHSLELEERDMMTSYKLEVTRKAFQALFEQSVCLELVLWHRMLGQKQDREAGRITSGAHVILPHVLSFLEGDPIDRIVEEIQK